MPLSFSQLFCCALLILPSCCSGTLRAQPHYEELEGLVVIEAESASLLGGWRRDTNINGFTGASYLYYNGDDFFNDPGNWPYSFLIRINTPGRYRFQWRSRIATGDSNTEHNDSWLRFPDADRFYAEKGGNRVYPRGTGMTPNPNGSSSNGWFKVYQNNLDNWSWAANTSDNDPHQIFVEFDTIGDYTLQVAGRSRGHAIDRIVLYHSSVTTSFATNTGRPESPRVSPSSVVNLPVKFLRLYPNPARERVSLTPPDAPSRTAELEIISANGRMVRRMPLSVAEGREITITLDGLTRGTYWLRWVDGRVVYVGRVVKE